MIRSIQLNDSIEQLSLIDNNICWSIIKTIIDQPGITRTEISRAVDIDHPNVCSNVIKLSRLGFVDQVRDGARIYVYPNDEKLSKIFTAINKFTHAN